MQTSATPQPGRSAEADTVAVGLFEGAGAPREAPPELGELIATGEARASFKSLALTHAEGRRWLLVGLGPRERFTAERARVAAAVAVARARELSTRSLCWQLPEVDPSTGVQDADLAAALVEGTILGNYRYLRHKSHPEEEDSGESARRELERLTVAGGEDLEDLVAHAALLAEAVNRARDLQNRPGNDLTPSALAAYAQSLGEELDGLEVKVEGREAIRERGMGAFTAVAQGSEQEPALITMTYDGTAGAAGADGGGAGGSARAGAGGPGGGTPTLGFVGKAVTFDSGGISLKPGAKMSEMKFDMSGGAAVIEASATIARLRLPVKLVAVIGATENLPSGGAVKPGDIVTAANGTTVEINNTDAEGRLVLADCLWHAISEGAEQLVDLATLTGAVIIALGSTYAGLLSNDDELAGRILAAGERTGEIVWRLPMHEEYGQLIKGRYGDLDNAPEGRKAGTIVGGTFLSNFVGDTPWAHLDIAGSAWELEREYVGKGASGYGVRLLVELARSYCG